jgi:hypothetical protein
MTTAKIPDTVRTIHPSALSEFGYKTCIAFLEVARDLRSGVIPPENYNQWNFCGTACCIAGHTAARLGLDVEEFVDSMRGYAKRSGLFTGSLTATPQLAADAIERCVYDYSDNPWRWPEREH